MSASVSLGVRLVDPSPSLDCGATHSVKVPMDYALDFFAGLFLLLLVFALPPVIASKAGVGRRPGFMGGNASPFASSSSQVVLPASTSRREAR